MQKKIKKIKKKKRYICLCLQNIHISSFILFLHLCAPATLGWMERAQKRAIAIYLFSDMFLLLARMLHVLVLRERSQRKTTEKTTRSGEENTPFSLIVQSIGQAKEEVGWFHLLLLGGAFTHTHSVVLLLLLLLCLSFPSSIPVRVYLFCGVASGRLGLTQQPSIRSCAHAGRETLLLHRLLFLPNKKIIKKSIWTVQKSRFPFFFSCWFHRQQVFCLFVLDCCCVNQHLCDAQHKAEGN